MKSQKKKKTVCWFLAIGSLNGLLYAGSFAMNDHGLNIFTSSPPALMFVKDSQGRITGADATVAMDANGWDKKVQNIPTSFADVDNPTSDDPASLGQPSRTTQRVMIPPLWDNRPAPLDGR